MQSSPNCLLLGASGFVGTGVWEAIRQAGWRVTGATRANYDQIRGQAFDLVINANGNASRFRANQEPLWDFAASTESVYRSLFDFPTQKYVLISTVDVYPTPTTWEGTREELPIDPLQLCPYGFHKLVAEQLVRRHASNWMILRLAQMVGGGLKKGPLFDVLNQKPVWIAPESRLHYLRTRSVGELLTRLVDQGAWGEVFNLCGRGSVPLSEVLELLPPGLRNVTYAARERQAYEINTDKADRLLQLPDSWSEVREFVQQYLRSQE